MLMRSTSELSEVGKSVSDFKKYLELAGWQAELSQNAVLLIYVCELRLGHQALAKGILEEAAAKCDKTAWPYPVVAYLRDEIKEDELMGKAQGHEQETEARAVVSLHHWHNGRRDNAKGHMDWLQAKGHGSVVSYSLVLRELEKLSPERTMETERYYSHPLH
jgi:lipoprotein NlpI